jgi:hypothetical protein
LRIEPEPVVVAASDGCVMQDDGGEFEHVFVISMINKSSVHRHIQASRCVSQQDWPKVKSERPTRFYTHDVKLRSIPR